MITIALIGLVAGIAATACMTALELVFYWRDGIDACLDWVVNQRLLSRLNGRDWSSNFVPGLAMHFGVGTAIGLAFSLVTPSASSLVVVAALGLSAAMWCSLLLLYRMLTGRWSRDGSLGALPAIVSAVGHLVYGIVLSAFIVSLR